VLGFPRRTVLRLLLLEGALFGAAGAILAVGFMNLFARLIGKALIDTQWAGIGALLRADATMVAVVASLSLLVAVASSLIPALNLSRRPIVSLMREAA
jgi:ABC-type antimicrobial peptide transport system permease subunit